MVYGLTLIALMIVSLNEIASLALCSSEFFLPRMTSLPSLALEAVLFCGWTEWSLYSRLSVSGRTAEEDYSIVTGHSGGF